MDRTSAERVFALIAEISGELGGKIVAERWWLIWIVMGVQVMITSLITQTLQWNGAGVMSYVIVWSAHIALMPVIIAFIHRRSGGQRTATESYIWWIWGTFAVASMFVPLFDFAAGQPIGTTAPFIALLGGVAFAMMGMVTHRFFRWMAGGFAAMAAAMTLLPDVQFLIYGAAWMAALVGLGIYFRATLGPRRTQRL